MSIVAIVGRPNVGKSTLFNRLVGMRKAIVNDMAGTTRDRHYGTTDWNGREFSVIDTGGYVVNSDDIFEGEIRKQVALAIDEADLILFMVEVSTGITDVDMEIADILRRTTKKVITVVNKVDNSDQLYLTGEFFGFGLGEPISISSMTGSGTGDLMDKILEYLPEKEDSITDDNLPKITVVGRPNVGKSSLTNALLGDERNIVTPIAGTTRDSISTRYNKFGMDFYLVDTAGLRKKGKLTEVLEFYSVKRIFYIGKHLRCIFIFFKIKPKEAMAYLHVIAGKTRHYINQCLLKKLRINRLLKFITYSERAGPCV